jgi:hypothetical protein
VPDQEAQSSVLSPQSSSVPLLELRRVGKVFGGAVTAGCLYATRCPYVMEICGTAQPPPYEVGPAHRAACYLYQSSAVGDAAVAAR